MLTGLSSNPKRIPAKYFYDDVGSELFQKITQHEDYYPARKEFAILESLVAKLPATVTPDGGPIDIIELGAGDGHKSRLLIDAFLTVKQRVNYYPVDISHKAMMLLEKNIPENPRLDVNAIVADYFTGLAHVGSISKNRKLVLFLGSNIGNLERWQALEFLRRVWKSLNEGDHMITGFDQKKSIDILNHAYNDSAGYTRQFNLNVLARINRELGGDFTLEHFCHYGFYNPLKGAMESYLVSLLDQIVHVRGIKKSFSFHKYEPIHLEYSFKFQRSDIEYLCRQTGFQAVKHFADDQDYFVDSLWKVLKSD